MKAENTANPIAKLSPMISRPSEQQPAEHEHVQPHRCHPAKPGCADTGHDIFGLRTPSLRQQSQEGLHEHRGFDRDQERGDDDQHHHEQDPDEGQSDLFHRADEPRRMLQVSVDKSGELRREAMPLVAGEAMDVAVGAGEDRRQALGELPDLADELGDHREAES